MDQVDKELLERLRKAGYRVAFEMSRPRGFILEKTRSKSETICEHILKCIVYSNDAENVEGWIDEIAEELLIISRYPADTRTERLKEKDYLTELMYSFGNEESDMLVNLSDFRRSYTRGLGKKNYPPFVEDEKMAKKLWVAYIQIVQDAAKLLANKNTTKQDFIKIIKHGLGE